MAAGELVSVLVNHGPALLSSSCLSVGSYLLVLGGP